MNKNSTTYTFGFALLICVVCSFLLALVSEGLSNQKEMNIAMDIKKNILKSVDLRDPLDLKAGIDVINKTYNEKIEELVINAQGEIVPGKNPRDIRDDEDLYPLYRYKENDSVRAYAFPIVGKGLWSTLYGYFSLEPDAKTVRGITFYQHGETPGLGAEIEQSWFQDNFKGKKVWDDQENKLRPVAVIKGKVDSMYSGRQKDFYVDGISGATMTSKGVTEMIAKELKKYEPYFSDVRFKQ
jgi:Na+-transporting NADH:ubiquinone oxidoreductase subunit C